MTYPTPEEVKQIAMECGLVARFTFYGTNTEVNALQNLQSFYQHAYEEGRKMQRESDAILVKRHPDAQLATLGDWTLTVATVLNEAIRNNTGE